MDSVSKHLSSPNMSATPEKRPPRHEAFWRRIGALGIVMGLIMSPWLVSRTVGIDRRFAGYKAPVIPVALSEADIARLPRSHDGVCAEQRSDPTDCIELSGPAKPNMQIPFLDKFPGVMANGLYSFSDELPREYQVALADSLKDPVVRAVSYQHPTIIQISQVGESYQYFPEAKNLGTQDHRKGSIVITIPSDIITSRDVHTMGGLKAKIVELSAGALFDELEKRRYQNEEIGTMMNSFAEQCRDLSVTRVANALKVNKEAIQEALGKKLAWLQTDKGRQAIKDSYNRTTLIENIEDLLNNLSNGKERDIASHMVYPRDSAVTTSFEGIITAGITPSFDIDEYLDGLLSNSSSLIGDTLAADDDAQLLNPAVFLNGMVSERGVSFGDYSTVFTGYVSAIQTDPKRFVSKMNELPPDKREKAKKMLNAVRDLFEKTSPALYDKTNFPSVC